MIRVLLLDLGGTLVGPDAPLPGAVDALGALSRFETATGDPLQLAVVSDFTMPAPGATKADVDRIVREYLALLDGFGLRRFFRPVDRRVTLSTQAGVNKPDRAVYELALTRLGTGARLADCLSITEDAGHVAACKRLGMTALRFGADFTDWADAPFLIRRLVAPASVADAAETLRPWLAARGMKLVEVHSASAANAAVTVRSGRGPQTPVTVRFDPSGRAVVDERDAFLHSLVASGQVAPSGDELPPGATHTVELDAAGEPQLTRKRFSAI